MSIGRSWRVVVVVALLLFAACGDADDGGGDSAAEGVKKVTVGLPVAGTFESTMPLHVAEQEGYFEDEGLEVDVVAFEGGADLVKAMASGAVQVGAGSGFDAAAAVAKGVPLKAFAGIVEKSPVVLITGADSDFSGIGDLAGANIGITRFGSLTEFTVRAAAESEGIDPESINMFALGGASTQVAALERGEVDAFMFTLDVGLDLEAKGVGKIVFRSPEVIEDDQYSLLMASPEYLESDSDTLTRLLRGIYRAVQFMKENPEEGAAATAEALDLPEDQAANLFNELVGNFSDDGTMNTVGLEFLASQLPELDIAPEVPELEEFYTDEFIPVQLDD